jgi:hypothetical protein
MEVVELVDSVENSFTAKFQHIVSCSFCDVGVQKS